MRKSTVTIQAPTTTYDEERNAIKNFADVATLKGFILPENGDLVQRIYGLDEKVTHRFIYKGQSAFLVKGNRIVEDGISYDIIWPANYCKKVLDVKLQLVTTNDNTNPVVEGG